MRFTLTMPHVQVPFDDDLHAALEAAAKQDGRSKAGQVRHYCKPHLEHVMAAMRQASKDAPARIKNHRKA